MLSKRASKQDEESRKLNAFCRYLRKNPDLFISHDLHHLMLEDQDKKGKSVEEEKPIEIVAEPAKLEENKIEEPPIEIVIEPEKIEEKKKEKKPRKPRKKIEKIEPKNLMPDLEASVLPLEREQACPKLEVQEEKESELNEENKEQIIS